MGQYNSNLFLAKVIRVEMNFLSPSRFDKFKFDQSDVGSSKKSYQKSLQSKKKTIKSFIKN